MSSSAHMASIGIADPTCIPFGRVANVRPKPLQNGYISGQDRRLIKLVVIFQAELAVGSVADARWPPLEPKLSQLVAEFVRA